MRYLQLDFWLNLLDAFRDAWDDVQNFHDCDCAEREVCEECAQELWWDPTPEPVDESAEPLTGISEDVPLPGFSAEMVVMDRAVAPTRVGVIVGIRGPDGKAGTRTIHTVEEFQRVMGYSPAPCWGLPREEDLN
jgi:hypothetical protein